MKEVSKIIRFDFFNYLNDKDLNNLINFFSNKSIITFQEKVFKGKTEILNFFEKFNISSIRTNYFLNQKILNSDLNILIDISGTFKLNSQVRTFTFSFIIDIDQVNHQFLINNLIIVLLPFIKPSKIEN